MPWLRQRRLSGTAWIKVPSLQKSPDPQLGYNSTIGTFNLSTISLVVIGGLIEAIRTILRLPRSLINRFLPSSTFLGNWTNFQIILNYCPYRLLKKLKLGRYLVISFTFLVNIYILISEGHIVLFCLHHRLYVARTAPTDKIACNFFVFQVKYE